MITNTLLFFALAVLIVGNIMASNNLVATEIKVLQLDKQFSQSSGKVFNHDIGSDLNMLLSYALQNGMVEHTERDTLNTTSQKVVVGLAR